MAKKAIVFSSLIILLCGGYLAFWNYQEEKVISVLKWISDHPNQFKVSYDSISKNKNILQLGVDVKNLRIEYSEPSASLENSDGKKNDTYLIFDNLHIKSDIFLKNFLIRNLDNIKYHSIKGGGSAKYDFDLKLNFLENPLNKKFFKNDIDSAATPYLNLRFMEFKNNGYEIYGDGLKVVKSNKNSLLSISNLSDKNNYLYNLLLSVNSDAFLSNDFVDANYEINFDLKTSKGWGKTVDLDIKKISIIMKDSSLNSNGNLSLSLSNLSLSGKIDNDLENYKNFFNSLRGFFENNDSFKESYDPKYINFIEAVVPEISEKKSETVQSIACVFEGGKVMVGKKSFDELKSKLEKLDNESDAKKSNDDSDVSMQYR